MLALESARAEFKAYIYPPVFPLKCGCLSSLNRRVVAQSSQSQEFKAHLPLFHSEKEYISSCEDTIDLRSGHQHLYVCIYHSWLLTNHCAGIQG